jgi:hypothetical protein
MAENAIILFAGAAIVAILGLVFPWSGINKRQLANKKSGALEKLRRTGIYRGVTIRPGKCATARRFRGKPFSFDQAPPLPLAGCNTLHCACHYQGLPEHRKRERRNTHDRRDSVRFDAERPERRTSQERRQGNINWRDPGD